MQNKTITLSNCALGTHPAGNKTYRAHTPMKHAYCFGVLNNSASEINVASGAKVDEHDRAIGIITDAASVKQEPVNVALLGSNDGTLQVRSGADIVAGELITSDSNGSAISFNSQTSGEYFIYGIALENASKGNLVEFTPTTGLEKTKK